jgi:SAM-dependent methyltransferase
VSTLDRILQTSAAYYAAKLAEHGATPRGVDWNDAASQALRHRQFLRLIAAEPAGSVADVGCGFGDFLPFLRGEGVTGDFIGYDIAPQMIAEAMRLHGEGADRQWRVGLPVADVADFAIASGVFNVKGETSTRSWAAYLRGMLDVLHQAGRSGFGANFLSLRSDPERRRGDLFYADPARMLAHCQARYGRSVALLHDYGLYEFTIVVRK